MEDRRILTLPGAGAPVNRQALGIVERFRGYPMDTIGIDPGKMGAIARLYGSGPLTFYPLPLLDGQWCPAEMGGLVRRWSRSGVGRVIIEECHAFPGISAAANASVMEAYGMWRGSIGAEFPPSRVFRIPANEWKKAMMVEFPLVKAGKKATSQEKKTAYDGRKQAALVRARAEFGLPFRTPKGRDMDGEAEAALIALYGSRL